MQDQAKPDTLNAAQLQNLQRAYQDELKKLSHRMELRDRALDQACAVVKASFGQDGKVEGRVTFSDPLALAQAMFKFLTADLPAPAPPPDRQTPA